MTFYDTLKHWDPAKAPWPPGVDLRVLHICPAEVVYQLRPGAALPHKLYMQFAKRAMNRASKQSANPCMN